MSDDFIELIKEIDDSLHEIQPFWVSARPEDKKPYMDRMDHLLDMRIKVMKKRDKYATIKL